MPVNFDYDDETGDVEVEYDSPNDRIYAIDGVLDF